MSVFYPLPSVKNTHADIRKLKSVAYAGFSKTGGGGGGGGRKFIKRSSRRFISLFCPDLDEDQN